MKYPALPFLLLALLLLVRPVRAEEYLTARLDRADLALNESVELTLDVPGNGSDRPDFSALEREFQVGPPRQIRLQLTADGQTRPMTQWSLSLQPRHSGRLVIPALAVAGHYSAPITLQVHSTPLHPAGRPVFMDVHLAQNPVYVQAQALLNVRIYHRVSLYDDSNLSALQADDAHIERLGEPRTYETRVDGIRYGIIDIRYAIFPRHSGPLKISGQTFSALSVPDDTGQKPQPFAGGQARGKAIQVTAPDQVLRVLPRPASWPEDAPWLPAASLTLSEAFVPQSLIVRAGDALTRIRTLQAGGLSAAQLPVLPPSISSGLRRYQEQAVLDTRVSAQGLGGTREETEALVPVQRGSLQLPGTEILWWNTEEDRLERLVLPARTLQVQPGGLAADNIRESHPARKETARLLQVWIWQASTLLLACTTVLGFALWWHARRQPAIIRPTVELASPALLDELRRACQLNDPAASRQALDAWARHQPETLAEMAARFIPLSEALDQLNGALYSDSEGGHWLGESLWQAICQLPGAPGGDIQSASTRTLPPLYPH